MATGPISGAKNDPVVSSSTGAANLFYKDIFSATATQELKITVLGETTTPQTPDEVIVQHVDLATLNIVMSYTGTWSAGQGPTGGSGYQAMPDVTVDFTSLLEVADSENEMGAVFSRIFAGTGAAGCGNDPSHPLMRDYSGDASLWPIQTYFTNATFSYEGKTGSNSGLSAAVLNSIPAEAVTSVDVSQLTCDTLRKVVNGGDSQADQLKKYVDDNVSQQNPHVRQLFEQAAAAGKIGPAGTQFVDGDSITLYVLYTMTRTKKFLLDDVQVVGVGNAAQFRPLGLTTAIVGGEKLESNPKSVLVAWQFVGKTEKGLPPSQAPL
jgi:hypothetical protein